MKKRTINETIDYIDKNIERRLNEISSTKIIGIYDNYYVTDSRTLQKTRVRNAAIERAPLKLEFVGKNNFGIVALFAIPYRVDSTLSHRTNPSVKERIRKGYRRIAIETDLKESMSSLGLNNKVQKKFSKVDSIDNVFSPKDVYNSFIMYSKNETGNFKRLSPYRNIMESIANYVGYGRYDTLEENIANFFKSSDFFADGCIMFDVPSDCRKFIKFICQLVNDAWRIDISGELDWHDFMH